MSVRIYTKAVYYIIMPQPFWTLSVTCIVQYGSYWPHVAIWIEIKWNLKFHFTLHWPHFKRSVAQELVATLLESEMENSSSQKVPLDSPGLADCRTRNIVQVDSCLVLSSFHYSTRLPKQFPDVDTPYGISTTQKGSLISALCWAERALGDLGVPDEVPCFRC